MCYRFPALLKCANSMLRQRTSCQALISCAMLGLANTMHLRPSRWACLSHPVVVLADTLFRSCCWRASSGQKKSTCLICPARGQRPRLLLICASLALTSSTDLSSTAACSWLVPLSSTQASSSPCSSCPSHALLVAQHSHAQPRPNAAQYLLHNGQGRVLHKRRLSLKLHVGQQFQRILHV